MISMYAEYSGRTLYVALSSDTIEGAKNGDTLYEMDTGKRYVYNESNDAWDEQPEEGGGGGSDLEIMQHVVQQGESINAAITNAQIPLKYQNEILIWNVTGTNQQAGGSISGKWGFQVVQNGAPVQYGGWYQRAFSIAPPDSMTPNNSFQVFNIKIVDGVFVAPGGTTFNVGAGNVVEFVQIPYNINWGV